MLLLMICVIAFIGLITVAVDAVDQYSRGHGLLESSVGVIAYFGVAFIIVLVAN